MHPALRDHPPETFLTSEPSDDVKHQAIEDSTSDDAASDNHKSMLLLHNSYGTVDFSALQRLYMDAKIPFALVQEIVLLKRQSDTFEVHRKFSRTSGESELQVLNRISSARHQARQFAAYTCVVEYLFAEPRIDTHFYYKELLATAAKACSDEPLKLVDVGCCVGTDIRKLIVDGFPAHSLTAMDKEARFFDLGLKLYNQSLSGDFPVSMVEMDLLDPLFPDRCAQHLSTFDSVHCANVVHLFGEDQQIVFLRNLSSLVKPGGVMWGRQVGESDDSPTKGVDIEGKGHRCTVAEFMRFLQDATGWNTIHSTYMARLVPYHELRLKQDYKNWSLEWVVKKPDLQSDHKTILTI